MSDAMGSDTKSEEEVQENIDKAVEDVRNLDFATLEEVIDAFRR